MLGTRLSDRYELKSEVGRGGMGYVYRAYDPVLKRDVAVKLIPPLRLARETEDRFHREAQVVAQMDHPSIVPIHDYGRHDGALFFVMPLVEGRTLRWAIDQGRLPLGDVVQIGAQVAEALDYSQSRGIVHRDIKPENIMVTWERGDLRVRVMDFGLARDLDDGRLTHSDGLLMGTPAYLSPEQVAGRKVDYRSDLYSLGVVLYECLVGEAPFVGPLHAVVASITSEAPVSMRDRGLEVDSELDRLVHQCLAKNPAERPASGRDLASSLLDYWQSLHDSQRLRLVLPGPPPTARQGNRLTLVGRRGELGELEARLTAALDGECQVALVGGDAGTGKTRLLREFERRLRHRAIRVLWGRFADRQSAAPYEWFCELLQERFRILEADEVQGPAASQVDVDMTDLAPDLLHLFPTLGEVAVLREAARGGTPRLTTAHESGDSASGVGGSSRFFELLASALIRIGGGEPLVLLLDNLQHGEDSLDGLCYIVRRLAATPTFIVGSYRTSEVEKGHALERFVNAFRDDPRLIHFTLRPLDREAFRKLVESLMGSEHLDASLVDSLFEATEGNPFFAQELVRSLNESGGIRHDDSKGWLLAREVGLSTRALPGTMQQAIEKRIERLQQDQQKLLSFASVLGKTFAFRDLAHLMAEESSADLEEGVDTLVGQGLLVEEAEGRGERLSFSSGIVRDHLYGELPRRKRRALHRRHATGLEERWSERLERVYPQLVHHFYEGDVAEKTVRFALLLARECLDAWSPEDALRACKKALEFVEEEEVDDATRRRGEFWALVAEAQSAQGRVGDALRRAERAFAIFHGLEEVHRASQIAAFAARASWQARRSEETRRWVRKGSELARRSGDDALLRELLALGATAANLRGEHQEARQLEDEAARIAIRPRTGSSEPDVPTGGRLVTVMPGELNTFDPADLFADWQAEVSTNVFETLIDSDGDGHLQPSLASSWTGDSSGRRFVFTLRPEILFADGEPLVAEHVIRSLERAARKEGRRPAAALRVIAGMSEFLEGATPGVEGMKVDDQGRLVIHLTECLPHFPALLTDPGTAVVREVEERADDGGTRQRLIGTGPFQLAEATGSDDDKVVLERSPSPWGGRRASLDAVEFLRAEHASEIAEGLRQGRIDIARDLLAADVEDILRESRFLEGLVEATKRNIYFVMFNLGSPTASRRGLRRALFGVLRTHDLVWRTLGRFAQPAVSFIPPGMLGHDPGRRRPHLSRGAAEKMLAGTGLQFPLRLRAAIQPLMVERYGPLLDALFALWGDLGVEVEAVTPTMEDYIAGWRDSRGIDLIIGRWNADFDDPDTFTHFLFHSRDGLLRHYFSSPIADRLLSRARGEADSERRHRLLGRFEDLLEENGVLLPLFHDIDYRIAGPKVRHLRLGNRPPYVDYGSLAKADTVDPAEPATAEGELHIPMAGRLETLDPAAANMLEQAEVIPSIFETLTRIDSQARVIPWLAEDFQVEDGGCLYRFRLRPGTRFHDGRRLTARDVRYSFERVLRRTQDEPPGPPVFGTAGLARTGIRELTRLNIISATEFVFELDEPLAIFPTLLSHPSFAIVPEDGVTFDGRWREGAVGTGPFRIVRFEKGRRLDLEGNPDYWRSGFPRSNRLVFHCGKSAAWIRDELRAGRLALATDLDAGDVETLRRDPKLAPGFRQAPRLSTYFLALNSRSGPFADVQVRRAFRQALGIDDLTTLLSPLCLKADGLLPPGLLGYEEPLRREEKPADDSVLQGLRLRVAVNPAYRVLYGVFWSALQRRLRAMGVEIEEVEGPVSEIIESTVSGDVDLTTQRWIADYPDPDSFVMGLLHSRDGLLSKFCGSADLDRLLDKARRESDPTLRHTLYQEVEEILQGEHLLLPLFHEQTYRFAHPGVEGLRLTGLSVPEVQYDELEWRG